jgi:hypothetical protein
MLRGRSVAEITKHKDKSVLCCAGIPRPQRWSDPSFHESPLVGRRKKHVQCRLKSRIEKTFYAARYQCKYKSSPRILCTEWRLKSTLDIFVRPRKEAILEHAHHSGFTWSWNDVTVRGGGKSWFVYVPLLWDISEQAQGVFKVSNNLRSVLRTSATFGRILSEQYD